MGQVYILTLLRLLMHTSYSKSWIYVKGKGGFRPEYYVEIISILQIMAEKVYRPFRLFNFRAKTKIEK